MDRCYFTVSPVIMEEIEGMVEEEEKRAEEIIQESNFSKILLLKPKRQAHEADQHRDFHQRPDHGCKRFP